MIAAQVALEAAPEIKKELHTFVDLLVEFFSGPDSQEKIAAVLMTLYASGIPQGIYSFFHDLHVLEKQIQLYIESLGSDIKAAESTLSSYEQDISNYFRFIEQGPGGIGV